MKWKNDRPDGWEEFKIGQCVHRQGIPEAGIEPETCETCPTNIKECHKDIEVGIDALLALLRASGTKTDPFRTNHNPIYMSNPNQRGVYVFIPAKKK